MDISKLNDFLIANSCFDKSKITATLEVKLSDNNILLVPVSTPENQLSLALNYLKEITQEDAPELLLG
jgi:uncharacterized protein YifN (PemK superfamily)